MATRPRPITVTITDNAVSKWTLSPYNDAEGLQATVVYEVPVYEVLVPSKEVFWAIRFGLVRNNVSPPPASRKCDAGLAKKQEARPSWVPTYSPHSFHGGITPGAWQLYPDKGFLIHEGASDPTRVLGGSLGCIEIVGTDEWNRFLTTLEELAGANCAVIGQEHAMLVKIQGTDYPTARRLVP
jgi:hypothetical protein